MIIVDKPFRVVAWNCKGASTGSAVWDYLLQLAPDVAMLQEVTKIPANVLSHYTHCEHRAMGGGGSPQKFSTVLLVKGRIGEALVLHAAEDWIGAEIERFAGNLVARQLLPDNGQPINAVSVYNPAWHINRDWLADKDITRVRLKLNPDVWVADILWSSLQHLAISPNEPWIIAGDFNLSESFDLWPGGPRGNREYLDRMAALGLVECLRQHQQILTPTFRHSSGSIEHQMDHIFTTKVLADRLTNCYTCPHDHIFDKRLSDHLPIVADFGPPV